MTKQQIITEILAHADTAYDRKKLAASVKKLLKRQDNDTRNACADSVVESKYVMYLEDQWGDAHATIRAGDALSVIMNCRRGLKP